MHKPEIRPAIDTITSGAELKRWYWLKEELVAYCKAYKIPYSAGKFELLDRIAHFMDTGEIPQPQRKQIKSNFDWSTEELTPETIITDNYKNTQNVRQFMTEQTGRPFHFNIAFMDWMRANVGKTLGDAIHEWGQIQIQSSDAAFQTEIADHNQYNQYLRDFFEANPTLTVQHARICWQFKRSLPSADGRHGYSNNDLQALTLET